MTEAGKISVSAQDLASLAGQARRNGTQNAFIDAALQWASQASQEIDRLTALLADHAEREAALRAELERERMRLVACGVVAMSNTAESAEKAREMHEDYRSASCDDVAAAVDREMALRAEVADLKRAVQHEADCVEAARAEVEALRAERLSSGLALLLRTEVRRLTDENEALRAAVGRARDALTLCTVVVGDSDDYDTIVDALRACGNALVAVALAQAKDAEAR